MRSSSNQSYRIVAIPGEGIGPEVVEVSLQLLQQVAKLQGFRLQVDYGWLGTTALKKFGSYFPPATIELCNGSDGIVFGAVASAGSNAAIVAALTAAGGPLGILGGICLLGLVGVVGDTVGAYGIEAILKAVYSERTKNESIRALVKEINDLPISDELKTKLTTHVESATHTATESEVSEEPRTV